MKKVLMLFLAILFGGTILFAQEMTKLYESRPYYIQSAMNFGVDYGGYWDLPGYPKTITKGMNLAVYTYEENKDRKFYMVPSNIEGYYEIKPGWEKGIRLDIEGGNPKMKTNGANVHTWEKHGGDWQKFRFKHLGNGKFKIYTTIGMVVCLAGRKNANGTNVHIWEDHDGAWMEWYLIDTHTKKPFIPKYVEPYSASSPDFFKRNKNKTFAYKVHGMTGLREGTAKVIEITNSTVKLTVTTTGTNPMNGKVETTTREMTLNFKNGKYKNGDWDCMECAEGTAEILPDGKQELRMSGEMHGIDFILE